MISSLQECFTSICVTSCLDYFRPLPFTTFIFQTECQFKFFRSWFLTLIFCTFLLRMKWATKVQNIVDNLKRRLDPHLRPLSHAVMQQIHKCLTCCSMKSSIIGNIWKRKIANDAHILLASPHNCHYWSKSFFLLQPLTCLDQVEQRMQTQNAVCKMVLPCLWREL